MDAFGSPFFNGFGVIFGGFWDPFWIILELLEALFAVLGPPGAPLGYLERS